MDAVVGQRQPVLVENAAAEEVRPGLLEPGHVLVRDDGHHAGRLAGRVRVDGPDAAARDEAADDDAVRDAGDRGVRGVDGGAGHLEAAVHPVDACADGLLAHGMCPTVVRARTMTRRASSILKALNCLPRASLSASRAAAV